MTQAHTYKLVIDQVVYYGSTENPMRRERDHRRLLRNSSHYNHNLQTAWDKVQALQFEILDSYDNREDAYAAEEILINSPSKLMIANLASDVIAFNKGRKYPPRDKALRDMISDSKKRAASYSTWEVHEDPTICLIFSTQKELAEYLGMSPTNVSAYFAGRVGNRKMKRLQARRY